MSSLHASDGRQSLIPSNHNERHQLDADNYSDAYSDSSSVSTHYNEGYSHSTNDREDEYDDNGVEEKSTTLNEGVETLATDTAPSCTSSPFAFCVYWIKWCAFYLYGQLRSLTKRWLIGVAILLVVNFVWAGSSMAVQALFSGFDKPFFLTYFSTSLFTLFLSGFVFLKSWRENDSVAEEMQRNAALPVPEDEPLLHNFQTASSVNTNAAEDGENTPGDESQTPPQNSHDSTRAVRIASASSGNPVLNSSSSDHLSSSGEYKVRMKEFVAESDDDSLDSPPSSIGTFSSDSPSNLLENSASLGNNVSSEIITEQDRRSSEPVADPASASSVEVIDGENSENAVVPIMTVRQVAILALQFLPIWFIANATFNWSLRGTSVTSNSIISTTSSFWTLLFCHLFKVERFTILRTLALAVTLGGVCLVAFADKKSGKDSLIGDALAIISAICYGVYASFLRIKIKDEKQVKMPMFFGFVGFFNLVLLWPFFILLHYTKLEIFEVPSIKDTLILTINGLIGTVFSDLLWSLVIFLTSATVATVGLSLNVPFSLILDITIKRRKFPLQYYMGAIVVLFGFLVANLSH